MYKKLIKKGENEYTYYYTNVGKEGKVKNIFLSSEHEIYIKVVDKKYNIYNSSFSNLLINSAVVNTLTNDCCLKCLSLDQIEELVNKANARYGASLGSGKFLMAFINNLSYLDSLKNSILDSTSNCLILNSCSDNFDLNKHSSLYLLNSDIINSGAMNIAFNDENKYELTESESISENNILLSNTSLILVHLYSSFFSGDIESSNPSLLLGES